jgi:RNA polymerase sigma-70 factor (ECF subfamily)
MHQDRQLIERLRQGDPQALRACYEMYKDTLLTTAACMLGNVSAGKDCLHDVFVQFASNVRKLGIAENLKGYLTTCIANRARDMLRQRARQNWAMDKIAQETEHDTTPPPQPTDSDQTNKVYRALGEIPDQQREVITLHLHGDMTFKEIARSQKASINTIQSRYRYGLDKLRQLLRTPAS